MQCVDAKFSDRATHHWIAKGTRDDSGFSLIELLLVAGVIGMMLGVLIPIGLRARTEAKYGIVRQNCSELASYTSQWAQQAILAQDEQKSFATIADYYGSLAGLSHAPLLGPLPGQWVADGVGSSNWRRRSESDIYTQAPIIGRYMNGRQSSAPENTVEEILPRDHPIRNPFTNTGIFESGNCPLAVADGGVGVVPGAVALGGFRMEKSGWVYFAFVFQGNDNTGTQMSGADTFSSGMNLQTMQGLQNGIFVARVR